MAPLKNFAAQAQWACPSGHWGKGAFTPSGSGESQRGDCWEIGEADRVRRVGVGSSHVFRKRTAGRLAASTPELGAVRPAAGADRGFESLQARINYRLAIPIAETRTTTLPQHVFSPTPAWAGRRSRLRRFATKGWPPHTFGAQDLLQSLRPALRWDLAWSRRQARHRNPTLREGHRAGPSPNPFRHRAPRDPPGCFRQMKTELQLLRPRPPNQARGKGPPPAKESRAWEGPCKPAIGDREKHLRAAKQQPVPIFCPFEFTNR